MIIDLLYFIMGCLVLVKSADIVVKSLSRIAAYFRMTEFVIGFIVMAFATSVPELFIGIFSAIGGRPDIALGNVIGANIIDLTLVIGIAALLKRGIKIETKAVKTDTAYMFLIALLPVILMLDNEMSRIDGIILIIVFVLYLIKLLAQSKRFREAERGLERKEFYRYLIFFITGIILLSGSAHLIIVSVENIADKSGLITETENDESGPTLIYYMIALLVVSIGTTLPELTFESKAILSDHQYMALGDCIGSVIANSTLVLGVTALIHPIETDFLLFITSAFFMLTVAFLFMTFIEAEKHILWQEAVALILLYVLFIIVTIAVGSYEFTHSPAICPPCA